MDSQWVAFNDQGVVGHANDSSYTISSLGTSAGYLRRIDSGATLGAYLNITNANSPYSAGTMSAPVMGCPPFPWEAAAWPAISCCWPGPWSALVCCISRPTFRFIC